MTFPDYLARELCAVFAALALGGAGVLAAAGYANATQQEEEEEEEACDLDRPGVVSWAAWPPERWSPDLTRFAAAG